MSVRGQESVRQDKLVLVKVLRQWYCSLHILQAVGMYAEDVRSKTDIDDSVEKQLYDEKKGTNNSQL